MYFGISSATFYKRCYTEDSLTEMQKLGVTDCEVFLTSFCEYTPQYIQELKKRALDTGVRIRSVHSLSIQFEPQLFGGSGRAFNDADAIYKSVLDGGQELGAEVYVCHGSANLKRGVQSAWSLERKAKTLTYLAEEAKKRGIRFTLENVHWCMYDHPGLAKEARELCDTDNLFFTLDIKQAFQSGYPIDAYIDDMGDRLQHVHICDCVRTSDGLTRTALPFEGDIDFAALREKLRAIGYDKGFILELYPRDYTDYAHLARVYGDMKAFFAGKAE